MKPVPDPVTRLGRTSWDFSSAVPSESVDSRPWVTGQPISNKVVTMTTNTANLAHCSGCSMWWPASHLFSALGPNIGDQGTFCSQSCYETWWNDLRYGILRHGMRPDDRKPSEPLPEPTPAVTELAAFGNVPVRAIRAFHELHVSELDEVRALVKDEPPGLLQAKGVGHGTIRKIRELLEEMDAVRKMLGLE